MGSVAAPVGLLRRVSWGVSLRGAGCSALARLRASGVCSVQSLHICRIGVPPMEGGSLLSTGLSPLRRRIPQRARVPGAFPPLVTALLAPSFEREQHFVVVVSSCDVVSAVALSPVVVVREGAVQ